MSENIYPINRNEQNELWQECWDDAREEGLEYAYTLAKTQALFAYRVVILSDRILDHDLMEVDDEELRELLERDKE